VNQEGRHLARRAIDRRLNVTASEFAAIVGAVTGPMGLVIALFSFFRDRSRLWVTAKVDWRVKNSTNYDPNEKYVVVTVSNIGRRPEHVSLVVAALPSGPSYMFSDTFFNPNETAEGSQPRQYLAKQTTIVDFDALWPGFFVVVRTSSGRQYRSKFLRAPPKGGTSFNYFERCRLRSRSIISNRWAFRRRFLE
jgi:hypothetical protein